MNLSRTKHRLVQGLSAQALSMVFEVGRAFILVPLFLISWSVDLYADWLVISSAAGLLSLCDLGLQPYFRNTMLSAGAEKRDELFRRQLAVALGLYGVVIAVALSLYALVTFWLVWTDLIDLAAVSANNASSLAWLLGLVILLNLPRGAVLAIYWAFGAFARAITIALLGDILCLCIMAGVLLTGGSPIAVALSMLLTYAVVWVLIIIDQKRQYPSIRYRLALPFRSEISDIWQKLYWFSLMPVAEYLFREGPILAIALIVDDKSAIVVFSTIRTVTGVLRALLHKVSNVLGTEMAAAHAQQEPSRLAHMYNFSGRLEAGVAAAFGGLVVVLAAPFHRIWTQGEVVFDHVIMLALLAGLTVPAYGYVSRVLLEFTNQPRELLIGALVRGLVAVALGSLLAVASGPSGMAIAIATAEITVRGVYFPWRVGAIHGLPVTAFVRGSSKALLAVGAFSVAVAYGASLLVGSADLVRITGVVALWAMVVGPLTGLILLTRDQRRWLLHTLVSALNRRALGRHGGARC